MGIAKVRTETFEPVLIGEDIVVDPSVEFGHNVLLYDGCRIGRDVRIGNNVIVYPNVEIGAGCVVQDNVILGKRNFRTSATGSSTNVNEDNSRVVIGENCIIASGAIVYWGVTIGMKVIIADMAIIREGVVLADYVKIGKQSIIEYEARIGERSRIQAHVLIGEMMTIGVNSFVGPHVSTACDKHIGSMDISKVTPPRIGNNAKIGEAVTLHPGAVVGDYAVVGAGSVVLESVPEHALAMGCPSRVVRRL